jgi:HlyD family secretion protein
VTSGEGGARRGADQGTAGRPGTRSREDGRIPEAGTRGPPLPPGRRLGLDGASGMDVARPPRSKKARNALIALGVLAVLALTIFIARLEPAAPAVDRDVLLFGTVERGSFVREVRGSGTLVPEQMVFVSAVTGGRVDEVRVQPGAEVEEGNVLVTLSNPDVELEALMARQQLTAARAGLVDLRRSLNLQILTERAGAARTRADYEEARRQAASDSALAAREFIARDEARRSREEAEALRIRLETDEARLAILESMMGEQFAVEEEQVARLQSVVAYQDRRVASMQVAAPTDGVVQGLVLEVGQWVQAGTPLARVAQPGRLKAEIRVPQVQARDVHPGQPVLVDTRTDTVPGRVRRVDPNVEGGQVLVEVSLEGELPGGARVDLSVDGTVEVERLHDVLHVDRPAYGQSQSTVSLFRVVDGGSGAVRVTVRLGRGSVNRIEVLEGLQEGDRIILTDMSRWDGVDRVRIR